MVKALMSRQHAGSHDLHIKTMAATTSMAEELLAAISLPNLKQIVAYLSENDAVTVDQYVQSEYAREYAIDITNIHWGGEMHQGHVYDVFAEYSKKDSVQVCLDMLQFVTENQKRYDWTAHLYLQMNNFDLNTWIQKMTYWGNGADALAIYALSDMLGIHSTVITRTKPWTTIEGGIVGDVFELLELSAVKMVYLGNDRYAKLQKKTDKCGPCYIGPNYNMSSMLVSPKLPSRSELDTVETLLSLSETRPTRKPKGKLNQKPKGIPKPRAPKTATQSAPMLLDAMDKIIGYEEDKVPCKNLKFDAMEAILECDEPVPEEDPGVLHVETPDDAPSITTKECSVRLRRLENILSDELVKVNPTSASDLGEGKYYTRSRTCTAKPRTGRRSRKASTGILYLEDDTPENTRPSKPKKTKPAHSGPSEDRIVSRSRNTINPLITLPPVPGSSHLAEDEEETADQEGDFPSDTTELYDEDDVPLSVVKQNVHGTIKIKHHVLERKTSDRKYKCRMCSESLPSCQALNQHHRNKHGILYCSVCNRPFNNPRSLTKHMYMHGKKPHRCTICGQKFPFASQLTTHKLTHRKKPNQRCMYPNWGRKFKSKSDLNRHAATHTGKWLVCPDCDDY